MLEKIIKKEVKDEEEEEEEETDEEEEEKELEGEGVGGKGLSVEEEWKLQHTEEGKTEPVAKLGKTVSRCYTFVVCSDSEAHCTYNVSLYSKVEWLIALC